MRPYLHGARGWSVVLAGADAAQGREGTTGPRKVEWGERKTAPPDAR